MVTKYLIAAVVALVVALSGALYGAKVLYDSRAGMAIALESAQAALSSQKALTERIQTQVQREKTRADANRTELRNALKENAEWASGRTPPAVADSLCKPPARCSPAAGTVR